MLKYLKSTKIIKIFFFGMGMEIFGHLGFGYGYGFGRG